MSWWIVLLGAAIGKEEILSVKDLLVLDRQVWCRIKDGYFDKKEHRWTKVPECKWRRVENVLTPTR